MLRAALAALPYLRSQAEALMSDTCTVWHVTGTYGPQDEGTGEEPAILEARFTSPCRITDGNVAGSYSSEQTAGRHIAPLQPELHLPTSAGRVYEDDLVVIDAVGSASDPQLLGREFRALAGMAKSHATARRIPVREA